MTSTPRILTLLAAGALALGLSACSTNAQPATSPTTEPSATSEAFADGACASDEGVTVVVDAGDLKGGDAIDRTACVLTAEAVTAADALGTLGVTLEGTEQYGDTVICRVDGLPSASAPVGSTEDPAYVEACATMPAAFAYWSLWVKPAGGAWDYAQEGAATQSLKPGDSVELLFTLDGAPAAPAA